MSDVRPPEGYLGTAARITSGPAPELVEAGYALEIADAPLLHRGLTLADLAHLVELVECGALTRDEAAPVCAVLLKLLDSPASEFPYDAVYGDAYNSRERELERELGPAAAGCTWAGPAVRRAGSRSAWPSGSGCSACLRPGRGSAPEVVGRMARASRSSASACGSTPTPARRSQKFAGDLLEHLETPGFSCPESLLPLPGIQGMPEPTAASMRAVR